MRLISKVSLLFKQDGLLSEHEVIISVHLASLRRGRERRDSGANGSNGLLRDEVCLSYIVGFHLNKFIIRGAFYTHCSTASL